MKQLPRTFLLSALCAFAFRVDATSPTTAAPNAPPGTRDEIEKSFHVRPGGTLNFDADVANVEIVTGDSDTVRIEFIREFKVGTAQEANELRQKLTVEMGQTDVTDVDAACTAGRLNSEFSLNGHQTDDPSRWRSALNGGGPLVMLRASAGNINLRK